MSIPEGEGGLAPEGLNTPATTASRMAPRAANRFEAAARRHRDRATARQAQSTRTEFETWCARRMALERRLDPRSDTGAWSRRAYERIVGVDDLVAIDFFDAMDAVATSVCLMKVCDRRGTGALVAPQLVITNHHVLPSMEAAEHATARFGVARLGDGVDLRLDPDAFFVTSPETELDYTVVALRADDLAKLPAGTSSLTLAPEVPPLLARGESVSIIQHPGGRPRMFCLRDNAVIDVDPCFVTYEADTNRGSSGAPVFDWQWRMVALHHAGVGPRDADGHLLDRTGHRWDGLDDHDVDWRANEGVRIDAVLLDLAHRVAVMPPSWRALHAALPTPSAFAPDREVHPRLDLSPTP
jgi:endonuclease G, mitochondrial